MGMQRVGSTLAFIRKLLKRDKGTEGAAQTFRGAAPVQTQEEQDATRLRMEAEMESQRERRAGGDSPKK